ncbi:MAG: type IV pilus assembly protein PilM [bacterium]|nr:type IV pilus assembly protein PilM [bacterium]
MLFHWPRRSVVGIDLSDRSIEALQLKRALGKPVLAAYSRVLLPPGVVEDGRILQPAALVEHVRQLLQKARPEPIKEHLCVIALPESQVYSHVFALPAAFQAEQIRRAILLEAEHFMPIPLRESYLDFRPIGSRGEHLEVAFAATRRGLVHTYLEVFKSAGLQPLAFEPESVSLGRSLVRRSLGDGSAATLIADVGMRTTNVHLVRQGVIIGSLTIPRAGGHFTDAVAAALKLSPEEAETRKLQVGFDERRGDGALVAALAAAAAPIAVEVKRFVAYAAEHRGVAVRQVVLAGGSALLPGFSEFLSAQLGIPVSVGDPLARLWQGRVKLPERQGVLYGNVIGLALRGLYRDPVAAGPNLLTQAQDRIRSEQLQHFLTVPKFDRRLWGMVSALALALLVLGGLLWYRSATPAPSQHYVVEFPPLDWSKSQAPQTAELVISFAPTGSVPANALSARFLEGVFTATDVFSATASATTATSNALVRLVNTTNRPQPLVANARLQADDGTVVRLASGVIVPADGSVTVAVPVPSGVTVRGRLRLPALTAEAQRAIYAEVVAHATVIGEKDVAAARERLFASARKLATDAFVVQQETEEYLLPIFPPLEGETMTTSSPVGTLAVEFSATLRQPFGGILVPKIDLASAIIEALGPLEQPLQSVSFTLGKLDLAERQISVIITTASPPVEK